MNNVLNHGSTCTIKLTSFSDYCIPIDKAVEAPVENVCEEKSDELSQTICTSIRKYSVKFTRKSHAPHK